MLIFSNFFAITLASVFLVTSVGVERCYFSLPAVETHHFIGLIHILRNSFGRCVFLVTSVGVECCYFSNFFAITLASVFLVTSVSVERCYYSLPAADTPYFIGLIHILRNSFGRCVFLVTSVGVECCYFSNFFAITLARVFLVISAGVERCYFSLPAAETPHFVGLFHVLRNNFG